MRAQARAPGPLQRLALALQQGFTAGKLLTSL